MFSMVRVNLLAICLLSSLLLSAVARRIRSNRASDFENISQAPRLCDRAVVAEACADLSPEEGTVTPDDIADRLSATSNSAAQLWDVLKLSVRPTCVELCEAVIDYVPKIGVLPPASDVVCYAVGPEVLCDDYVGPEVLPTLTPSISTHDEEASVNHHDVLESLPEELSSDADLASNESEQLAVLEDTSSMQLETWEMVKHVAYLFRIFPIEKPTESSLIQVEQDESRSSIRRKLGHWPIGGREITGRKIQESKAYVVHAIAAFRNLKTKKQMTWWYGENVYTDKKSRKKIKDSLNSVLHVLDNAHFVPYGPGCKPKTYAYVYPQAYRSCSTREAVTKPCTDVAGKRFVVYLCDAYFSTEDEMVETLVHEASHHEDAFLDDVKLKNGPTAYGRKLCRKLAMRGSRGISLGALKNADNFCYYVRDVADQVHATWGEVTVPVPPMVTVAVTTPEPEEDDDDLEPEPELTCMRPGPQGMHVKSMRPDKKGNCYCKYASTTCYEGNVKKCPYNVRRSQISDSRHHAKFAASCSDCSCTYQYI